MRGKIQGGGVPGPAVFRAAAALLSLSALSAPAFTVPELPPSAFADSEVSTNVAFNVRRSDVRTFDVRIELASSVSNCVQVAFGRDADGDGDLSPEETGLVLAWRGGRYCVENVPEGARIAETPASAGAAARFLHMRVATDGNFRPRTASFANEAGPCFAGLSAAVPDWLCRPDWNLLRVTRRGAASAAERCEVSCDYESFVIRVR